ncbi:MAG: 6-phosphogluconolactonase [Cyclobacteriaceae bacterium]|jgi:6-phosphogluconolactonase
MNQSDITIFKDASALALGMAKVIQQAANEGNKHIALSGGSTPSILFDVLAADYAFDLKWSNAHLYWGDERCVPPFNAQSNYLAAKNKLIDHVAIPTQNIHRIRGENDPFQEARRYSQRVKTLVPEINGHPQFDLIILGLGTDGHTASIFPDQMDLLTADDICRVATHPESGQKRISLTGKVLNNAKSVIFLVSGASKADVVQNIIERKAEAASYPASHIQPITGKLTWLLDEAAAAKLKK